MREGNEVSARSASGSEPGLTVAIDGVAVGRAGMMTEPTGTVFWPSVWTGTVAFDGFMRPAFEGNRKGRRKQRRSGVAPCDDRRERRNPRKSAKFEKPLRERTAYWIEGTPSVFPCFSRPCPDGMGGKWRKSAKFEFSARGSTVRADPNGGTGWGPSEGKSETG